MKHALTSLVLALAIVVTGALVSGSTAPEPSQAATVQATSSPTGCAGVPNRLKSWVVSNVRGNPWRGFRVDYCNGDRGIVVRPMRKELRKCKRIDRRPLRRWCKNTVRWGYYPTYQELKKSVRYWKRN